MIAAGTPTSPRTLILAGAAALTPVIAVVDPLALSPLFALATLLLILLPGRGAMLAPVRDLAVPAGLVLALSLWAMASALWSILPRHSLLEGVRLLLIGAGAFVLLGAAHATAPVERRIVAAAATTGLAFALAFLLIEAASDGAIARLVLHRASVPLQRYDRAASVAALSLWPALAGWARRRTIERGPLILATAVTVVSLESLGALFGLAAGILAFVTASCAPRLAAAAVVAGLAGLTVALPLAVPSYATTLAFHAAMPSFRWTGIHRLFIWRFTADRFEERPLLGWGMDSARALPGGKTHIAAMFPQAAIPFDAELLPLHPHNAILEWDVELGVPGALLALGFAGWSIWRAGNAPTLGAPAIGFATTALGPALLDYGAWQAWWLSALALSAAALTAAAAETPRDSGDTPARDRP